MLTVAVSTQPATTERRSFGQSGEPNIPGTVSKAKKNENCTKPHTLWPSASPGDGAARAQGTHGALRQLQSVALRVRGGVPAGKLAQLVAALGGTGVCSHLHLFAGVASLSFSLR